jgi:hypothetical protein
MKIRRRQFLHLAAGAAALSAMRDAKAQAYPARPITIIVPFPAGGPLDSVGRVLADRMRASLLALDLMKAPNPHHLKHWPLHCDRTLKHVSKRSG